MQSSQQLTQQNQDAFTKFFEKYLTTTKLSTTSVRELAQKLASKYFTSQIKPRHFTEDSNFRKKKPINYKQKENEAILQAKKKFQEKQQRMESMTKKLPPVPKLKYLQPRSISAQPPQKAVSAYPKIIKETIYSFYVGDGNNDELIKKLLNNRTHWIQIKDPSQKNINFKWQETEQGYEYRTLGGNSKESNIQMLNHFEFHSEVSNKYLLSLNIKNYCEKNQLNAYDYIPTSFSIECTNQTLKQSLLPFICFYKANCPQNKLEELEKTIKQYQFKITSSNNQKQDQYPTLYNGDNLWIFKPSNMNQGRGIHLVKSLQEIIDIYNRYQNGYKEHLLEVKRNEKNEIVTKIVYINTLMTEQFVIQKYIEKPLLINGRKFDIRAYVLITSNLQFFFYKEGQLRLATEEFDNSKLSNYIHLTNNAVQYTHPQYGKQEEGNQYTFDQASKYFNIDFRQQIITKLKQISYFAFSTIKGKLNRYKRKNCFEMFGMDFILDDQFKPWLIEINTNPSLEVTSKLLDQLFPRLMNDTFRLTLDKLFPQSQNQQSYPFPNYSDQDNLWEFVNPL